MNIEHIPSSVDKSKEAGDLDLKKNLSEGLNLKDNSLDQIKLLTAKDLPENYQAQFKALNDDRLGNVNIAVVPDDLWIKGEQPSESNAEKNLILVKQSYFETPENPDEIAWMIHELAHCQKFLDSDSALDYQKNTRTFAFPDLESEYSYPNNPVEQYTFTKQFQFLKEQGKSREDVVKMLDKYYQAEDRPFFDRLLDGVYN